MTSPAVGIAYMLWLRLRWGAAATVIYLFALSVAAHFLPADPMVMALASFDLRRLRTCSMYLH